MKAKTIDRIGYACAALCLLYYVFSVTANADELSFTPTENEVVAATCSAVHSMLSVFGDPSEKEYQESNNLWWNVAMLDNMDDERAEELVMAITEGLAAMYKSDEISASDILDTAANCRAIRAMLEGD